MRSTRRLLAAAALAPASLLATTLTASAASTTVLLYTGSEVSTTTAIDRAGTTNGTLHNVQATGSGYHFTGTGRIAVPDAPALNPGTSNFSYAVTMRLPANYTFTHDLSLVRRGASKFAGAYYKMELVYNKSSGVTHLECALRDSTKHAAQLITTATGLNDGNWHTLRCGKTASAITLTKNATTYTKAVSLGSLSSTQPLNFGAEQIDATTFWEQYIGDMKNITITRG